jgi:NADH dehydrogenase FAD-containing subunit
MWKRFSHLNELKQPNLTFKHGSVQSIDPETKVAEWCDHNGKTQQQPYDYLVVATGLKRHWPAVPKSGSYEEYLQDGASFITKITGGDLSKLSGRKIVVIGGGAVGIEFAGEIKKYYPEIDVTLVHSRSQVLSSEPLPSDLKDRVATMLTEEGVTLALGSRATVTPLPDTNQHSIALANGTTLTADFVIDSTRKGEPTTHILPQTCLNADKEIIVSPTLRFKPSTIPNHTSHFAVGDVIAWSGIKRAGSATVMGQAAAQNIYASILNSELPASAPQADRWTETELPSWDAVIGIAVGKQCLTYDPKNGIKYGRDVMQAYFGDDLGWAASLKYMGLTDVVEGERTEGVKEGEIKEMGEVREVKEAKMSEVGVKPVSVSVSA